MLLNLRVRYLDGSLGVCVEDPGGAIVFVQWDDGARSSCRRSELVVVQEVAR
jgi:hypothetical protein